MSTHPWSKNVAIVWISSRSRENLLAMHKHSTIVKNTNRHCSFHYTDNTMPTLGDGIVKIRLAISHSRFPTAQNNPSSLEGHDSLLRPSSLVTMDNDYAHSEHRKTATPLISDHWSHVQPRQRSTMGCNDRTQPLTTAASNGGNLPPNEIPDTIMVVELLGGAGRSLVSVHNNRDTHSGKLTSWVVTIWQRDRCH